MSAPKHATAEALELIAELAPMLEAGTIEDIEHHIRLLSEAATVVAAELKMRTIDASNPNYECLERSRGLAYAARNGEEIDRGVLATAIFEVLDLGSHECGEKNQAQSFNGAPKHCEIWAIVPMRWNEEHETFVDREGEWWSEEIAESDGEYSFFLGWMPAGEKVGDA